MGISCCKNTSKKYKPESVPVSKQPEALPNDPPHTETHIQSLFFNSQDLENVSGMNTSSNYKIPIIKEDIRSVYKFSKQIGYGTFGRVYLAHKQNESKETRPYAVKVMKDFNKNEKIAKVAKREISIMRVLDHPNIIQLYEIYEDEKYLSLVLEYCSGGDLFDYLGERHHLCEEEAAHIMHNILTSIQYLHSQQISHRDLKLQNFMFDKKGPEANLKLIDFGLSAQYSPEQNTFKTIVGSPLYIAPEIVLKKSYDYSCDIWSIGVIFYLLLSGNPPFLGNTSREIFLNICKADYDLETGIWKNISSEAKNLLRKFLKLNPKERISIEEAKEHEWFTKMMSKDKIESPIREPKNPSLNVKSSVYNIGVFKNFDKDSLSQFSLEGSKESQKEKKSVPMKLSRFKTVYSKDDDKMDISEENVGKFVHLT